MPASPLVDREVHVTEAIVKVFQEAGIDTVFGLSGGNTGRIFSRLAEYTDSVRTVLVRNEAHATSAAEAYAKVAHKPAVAMAQGSWLVGQGIVGTLEALTSCTPMILIGDLSDGAPYSQHGPYQSGTAEYGSWDARMAFQAVSKLVLEAYEPVQAVQAIQMAVKHALAGQAGPVSVLLHSRALIGNVGPESVPRLYSTSGYLAHSRPSIDVSVATDALRSANAPVIISGGGVRAAQAQRALVGVAEALGATVVTTAAGKGTFPEEHPLAGGVFGNFGSPVANGMIADADVLLVVGSKLGPSDTASEHLGLIDPTRQHIVQIDIEARNAAWTMPTDSVIVGDARLALETLLSELGDVPTSTRDTRAERLNTCRSTVAGTETSLALSDRTPIHPQRAIADLRSVLPDDAIVCADAGENRLMMCRYFQTRGAGDYLQPSGAGGMGYAIPAALGVKTRFPDRAVVAVCGDGGFSMALPALMTVVEERLPIVIVVLNNNALGWVKHSQRARGEQEFKSTLQDFDYAGIGAAIGLSAVRVSNPDDIVTALTEAVKSETGALVVIDVSKEQTFVDLRTPLLD